MTKESELENKVENEDNHLTPPASEKNNEKPAQGNEAETTPSDNGEGEKGKAEEKSANEPPPKNERWNQVYFRMKDAERRLSEKEKDIDAIRSHNKKLEESLEELKVQKADKSAEVPPDPAIDPDGYKQWHEFQIKRKDREFDIRVNQIRLESMIETQRDLHDDYDEMAQVAERDIDRNPELKDKIWKSANPAREAYKYAKGKMEQFKKENKEEEDRILNVQKASGTEGNTPPASTPKEPKLNDEEQRVVRRMWPELPFKDAAQKYINQKIAMGRA